MLSAAALWLLAIAPVACPESPPDSRLASVRQDLTALRFVDAEVALDALAQTLTKPEDAALRREVARAWAVLAEGIDSDASLRRAQSVLDALPPTQALELPVGPVFQPRSQLYVQASLANVHKAAAASSATLWELPIGATVKAVSSLGGFTQVDAEVPAALVIERSLDPGFVAPPDGPHARLRTVRGWIRSDLLGAQPVTESAVLADIDAAKSACDSAREVAGLQRLAALRPLDRSRWQTVLDVASANGDLVASALAALKIAPPASLYADTLVTPTGLTLQLLWGCRGNRAHAVVKHYDQVKGTPTARWPDLCIQRFEPPAAVCEYCCGGTKEELRAQGTVSDASIQAAIAEEVALRRAFPDGPWLRITRVAAGKGAPPLLFPYAVRHLQGAPTEQTGLMVAERAIPAADLNGSVIAWVKVPSYDDLVEPFDQSLRVYGVAAGDTGEGAAEAVWAFFLRHLDAEGQPIEVPNEPTKDYPLPDPHVSVSLTSDCRCSCGMEGD